MKSSLDNNKSKQMLEELYERIASSKSKEASDNLFNSTEEELRKSFDDKDELKILWDEPASDDNGWELKTTISKITYDSLSESFSVDLGDGAWAEVYGKDRLRKALQMARYFSEDLLSM